MMKFNCAGNALNYDNFKFDLEYCAIYRKLANFPIYAIVILLLSVYANTTLASESMKLNENDAGKTVEIAVGDELEIMLPGNPTTGYVWEAEALDATVLTLRQTSFMPGDHAIGSGGLVTLMFRAVAKGKAALKLNYHRPFEQNTPPINTFEVTVTIKK
jgi:inhibitor of cysteine peptidase